MTTLASRMVCAGCGAEAADPYPFRCPRADAGDDIDHVLTRTLVGTSAADPVAPPFTAAISALAQPLGTTGAAPVAPPFTAAISTTGAAPVAPPFRAAPPESLHFLTPVTGPNPFLEFRTLFHSYHLASAHGMSDADYVRIVEDLNEAVALVDGHGFVITPFARHSGLSARIGSTAAGGVWIKNETGNVSGSHKGRHLMGLMIYLQVIERLGIVEPPLPPLAIASCGNAALAAAIIARAARRHLRVFIPTNAPARVVDQLHAEQTICPRDPDVAGDPCYLSFRETIGSGALPFCCQGNENGLTIEGGETLAYEIIAKATPLDRVFIQVGGGALASSVIQAFGDALAAGVLERLPRFHAVQTRGAYPLARAYDLVADRVARSGDAGRELRYAAAHRSEFMWPWEEEPHSIAHGILDDETYDWLAVVKGMLESGGHPIVVDEAGLAEAHALAQAATGINVDPTGAAGLAGLLHLHRQGQIAPNERVAAIFSGAER